MQFIISVALHVFPLICATKEKQTMMVTVLYHQIRKSDITPFLKNSGLCLEGFVHIRWGGFSMKW